MPPPSLVLQVTHILSLSSSVYGTGSQCHVHPTGNGRDKLRDDEYKVPSIKPPGDDRGCHYHCDNNNDSDGAGTALLMRASL